MRPRLILASRSPRREEILRRLEIPFEVRGAEIDEDEMANQAPRPENAVVAAAYAKALQVARQVGEGLVLGFDTAVVVDGRRLGKPSSAEEAVHMIMTLSNRRHEVLTGVAVVDAAAARLLSDSPPLVLLDHEMGVTRGAAVGYARTGVVFEELSEERARLYVEKGESLDKAGAYGIQDKGSLIVKSVDGCYFNVVGLPVHLLSVLLSRFGVDLLAEAGRDRHGANADV